MVRGYYNKVYTYQFQNYIIANNNKSAMKIFEVNITIRTQLMYLFKWNIAKVFKS